MNLIPPEIERLLALGESRVVFGDGRLAELGERARAEGVRKALLVTDAAVRGAGHVDAALRSLAAAGIETLLFDGVVENPTTATVAAGIALLEPSRDAHERRGRNAVDGIVALGGGSVMDAAKGVNLLLTNGGAVRDYRGDPPPDVLARRRPLLPMLLVPTTAGTGSEAQSFALLADADTREKMACGDRRSPRAGGLRPRVAILDPLLTRTAPAGVAAAAGIDAIAHAVETAACRVRSDASREFSKAAWGLLSAALPDAARRPDDAEARARMLLGAHLAGCAIERSMLGAAHACANPLTARFGVVHGAAVGAMLPHVVRFNSAGHGAGDAGVVDPYSDLCDARRPDAGALAGFIESLLDAAGLPRRLRDLGVPWTALPELAADAARQWTAGFNPRPVGARELHALYQAAY